ncbi:MAG: lytic murein transglycosylase [Hyphomonadaceae bacterium]|nr:MAG: lytic murein transglycosylase [Hyphomonadaceae bacterium]KAF0184876.1 MAG: lytic murein transglycosylase [Hyphomonadaceae bacterium]
MKKQFATFLAALISIGAIGFAACADDDKTYVPPVFETSGNVVFDSWRADFASRAVNLHHKDIATIEAMMVGLVPNEAVIRLNNAQPEVTRPIWSYIGNAVSDQRVELGRNYNFEIGSKLGNLAREKGVPLEFAISIWAMESNYGSNKGNIDIVRALATFAYQGRRTQLGETELLAVADMLKNGDAVRETLVGSWAGAMGHTQFMPSSYLSKAIDGDGDGKRDIWNNPTDALASTLNYLTSVGWKADEPWGRAVEVSPSFDYSLADGQMRPLTFWRANGLVNALADLPNDWQARMFVPAGANGPKFLVGVNYAAIRHYNASDSYALSVALMADRIAGGDYMPNNWPTNNPPLGRTKSMELQTLLKNLGFEVGEIDGAPGARTKAALQAFQKAHGHVADGYPSANALRLLREASGMPSQDIVETAAPVDNGPEPVRMFGPPVAATPVPPPPPN